jgi:hydrogenase maturation factor HypF (carbamoyltransferase family)
MTTIIEKNGMRIIYNDHTGLQAESLVKSMADGNKVAWEFYKRKERVIVVSNFRNICFTDVADKYVEKDMVEAIKIMNKAIVFGVEAPIHKLIFNGFLLKNNLLKKVVVFKTEQEAFDYAVNGE